VTAYNRRAPERPRAHGRRPGGARAALIWSLDEAPAAAVSRRTILRLENDQRDIQAEKVAAIRRAFEAAGVRFLYAPPDTGGVVPPPS
jgi:hypothetical protein